METILMNTENNKTSEPHKFVLNLSQKLYYTWKNIRQQHKNSKLKIIAPTWNDVFEFPHDSFSVSDTQDYIEYIIKNHETLTTNPLIFTSTGIIIG